MDKTSLKHLIDVAAGRIPADLVIKNSKIVDVYSSQIVEGKDIAIVDGVIAGIGDYEGREIVDANGAYAAPGLIESHIHIESSYVTPEEIGRLLTPKGTTTIIADPHEIVNVAGLEGLDYMVEAARRTKLDIRYMLPSCVPATPYENSGADIDAAAMEGPVRSGEVWGIGEFMDFPGVVNAADGVLDKLMLARDAGMVIDGHSPGLGGNALNAYAAAGIRDDHECETALEAADRVARGMYVMLRQGSACHDFLRLLPAVTPANSRRFVLCSDDRQPKTIFEQGHLDHHLRMCVSHGIDPVTAIQMGTLNAAECFRMSDRGAIAPGLRADIVLFDNLEDFHAQKVWILGELVAENDKYLFDVERCDISSVMGHFHVKDFSEEKLKLHLKAGHIHLMQIVPGGVVTKKAVADIDIDSNGDFVYDPCRDIVKIAVVERHHNTGKVAVGLLGGYGMKNGAIALSISHDSHNIIVVGTNNRDMAVAVEALIAQGGGIVLADQGAIIDRMPFIVGGIMTDQSGEWVNEKLSAIHAVAFNVLHVSADVDPVMTLCFMSLSVIPELKRTAEGLFEVNKFDFIPLEAEG